MPFSSGTYSLPSGNPVVTGTTISSTTTNTTNSDIATALSSCILKDGTQTVTANIPMASHKLTGLSAGTTAGDSVEYAGSPSFTNLAYTGTLTGSTGILNIGSGQVYKDASGNVGIGTSSPASVLNVKSTAAGAADIRLSYNASDYMGLSSESGGYKLASVGGGFLSFATSGTERARIDASGNLLVGTTSTTPRDFTSGGGAKLAPSGGTYEFASSDGGYVMFLNTTATASGSNVFIDFRQRGVSRGNINTNGSTTSYVTSSDRRLKTNIVDAPSALDSINAIKVRSFDWKESGGHQDYGYIAQELLEVVPEAVSVPTNEDEMMGVDFGKLTPRLVKAIQEQQTLIEALTARLTKAGL